MTYDASFSKLKMPQFKTLALSQRLILLTHLQMQTMDKDLRKRYSNILEAQYQIVRTAKPKLNAHTKWYVIGLTIVASPNTQANKINGYKALNENNYSLALNYFNKIQNKNTEDKFFIGISQLKTHDYTNAVETFKFCLSNTKSGEPYFHEIKLYFLLSLILNDQFKLANQHLQNLENDSWEFKQLVEIKELIALS